MNKKKIVLIGSLAVVLIAAVAINYIEVSIQDVGTGEILHAFVLPDGGSIALLLSESADQKYFYVAFRDRDGVLQTGQMQLPVNAVPDKVLAGVCGDKVHVFANWLQDYDFSTAPVYEFTWTLAGDSGICDSRSMPAAKETHVIQLPAVFTQTGTGE